MVSLSTSSAFCFDHCSRIEAITKITKTIEKSMRAVTMVYMKVCIAVLKEPADLLITMGHDSGR